MAKIQKTGGELQIKTKEFSALQVEIAELRRTAESELESLGKELDSVKDNLSYFKRRAEKMSKLKDQLKADAKKTDQRIEEQNNIIKNFSLLQKTLDQSKKQSEQLDQKINEEVEL